MLAEHPPLKGLDPEFVTVADFARRLGVSDATVRRLLGSPLSKRFCRKREGEVLRVDVGSWLAICLPVFAREPIELEENAAGVLWRRSYRGVSRYPQDGHVLVSVEEYAAGIGESLGRWRGYVRERVVPSVRFGRKSFLQPKRLKAYFKEELVRLPY